ncbi:DUF2948 family protein [Mesorhizobium xinjiangense]|uniref:DUF2948 family protein n=1 Tax=Mesorhizobium xinjiangense TaxID=2678685 RepID=UPI0012EE3210|nr:DUF2948 family protein [Mesorhizobium xinjiangense]
MEPLKLAALDADDLQVISAHVQDAVARVEDIDYRPGEKRFLLPMNRFVWKKKRSFFRLRNERRRAVLHVDRVLSVATAGIDRSKPDDVLSLLAIEFSETEAPAGTVTLIFSGNAAIRLEVECIEARLADLGAAWETSSRPAHDI